MSWFRPALAVQRSTLTEMTACALKSGVITSFSAPLPSRFCQVAPSEPVSRNWVLLTLTKCEILAPPVCNGAKTPGVPLVTQIQSMPLLSVQTSPRECALVVGAPAAAAGVTDSGARPPAQATTPIPAAADAAPDTAKPLVALALTAIPSVVWANMAWAL